MPDKINLNNPNDPKTKKYLQELGEVIYSKVIALTEMYKTMCDIVSQKEKEERENEFVLELKQQAEIEAMKQHEVIQRIDAGLSQPEQQIDELNKLQEELEELRQNLILRIHHLESKITQCDREIEDNIVIFNQHSTELQTLDAHIIEQVIAKIEKYGVRNANGEELDVNVEVLRNIQIPSMRELYNDPGYHELLVDCSNGPERQMRVVNWRRESIYQTFIKAIDPEAGTPETVMGYLYNQQLHDACMKGMGKAEDKYSEKMSEMIKIAVEIEDKKTGINVLREDIAQSQQQLKKTEDQLNRTDSILHRIESEHPATKKLSPGGEKKE